MSQLIESDESMAISCFGKCIPIDEDADGGEADISSDHGVSDKNPVAQQIVVLPSWRLVHNVGIGWVEAEGCGRGSICHKIDPKKLDRGETLWHAKECREENG